MSNGYVGYEREMAQMKAAETRSGSLQDPRQNPLVSADRPEPIINNILTRLTNCNQRLRSSVQDLDVLGDRMLGQEPKDPSPGGAMDTKSSPGMVVLLEMFVMQYEQSLVDLGSRIRRLEAL